MPVTELFRDEPTRQLVRLLDVSGTCVQLPQDLKTPLARYVAKVGLTEFRRYVFGRVFRLEGAMEFGLAPREIAVAHFDIVAPNSSTCQGMADAMVVETTISALLASGIAAEDLTVHLGHTGFWQWILQHQVHNKLSDSERKRLQKALQMSQPGRGKHLIEPARRWTALQQELQSAPLPDPVLQPFQALLSTRNTDLSVVLKAISLSLAANTGGASSNSNANAHSSHHHHSHSHSHSHSHHQQQQPSKAGTAGEAPSSSRPSQLLAHIRQELEAVYQHIKAMQLPVPIQFDLGIIPHDSTLNGVVFRVIANVKSRKIGAEMLAVGGRYSQLYQRFQPPNAPAQDLIMVGVEIPLRHTEDRAALNLGHVLSRSHDVLHFKRTHAAAEVSDGEHSRSGLLAHIQDSGVSETALTGHGARGHHTDWTTTVLQHHYDVALLLTVKRPSSTLQHFMLELARQLWAAGLRVYVPVDAAAGQLLWHDTRAPLCLIQIKDTSARTQQVRLKIDGVVVDGVAVADAVDRVSEFAASAHLVRCAHQPAIGSALHPTSRAGSGVPPAEDATFARGVLGAYLGASVGLSDMTTLAAAATGVSLAAGAAGDPSGFLAAAARLSSEGVLTLHGGHTGMAGVGGGGGGTGPAGLGGAAVGVGAANALSAAAAASAIASGLSGGGAGAAAGLGAGSAAAGGAAAGLLSAAGSGGGSGNLAAGAGSTVMSLLDADKHRAFRTVTDRLDVTVVTDPNVSIPAPRRRRMRDNALTQTWPVISSLLNVSDGGHCVLGFAVDVSTQVFHEFAGHVRVENGHLRPIDWTPGPRCDPQHRRILEDLAEKIKERLTERSKNVVLMLINLSSGGDIVLRSF